MRRNWTKAGKNQVQPSHLEKTSWKSLNLRKPASTVIRASNDLFEGAFGRKIRLRHPDLAIATCLVSQSFS
jgi:hypothetical protein